MKNLKYFLFASFLFLSATASANTMNLSEFVDGEINNLDGAFSEMEKGNQEGMENNEDYFFRRFWLRVRPKIGLSVPELAALDIIPEIEMLWERETPDGWEIYKP